MLESKSNIVRTSFVGELSDSNVQGTIAVLGKAAEGWSRPDIVRLSINGNNLIGYRKLTSVVGQKNGIERILCQIGNVLKIPMADSLCIFSGGNTSYLDSTVSISVVQSSSEKFVNFREMKDELFFDLQSGVISETSWIKRWKNIRKRKNELFDVHATSDNDYNDTVEFALQVSNLYCEKYSLSLLNFQQDYIKMLLFDILCGQADRSASNYGIIINQPDKTARLSPLFDNSTLTKPYMTIEQIGLNHVILDRRKLIHTVHKIWGNEIQKATECFINNKEKILYLITNDRYISQSTIIFLTRWFNKGFEIIEQFEKDI